MPGNISAQKRKLRSLSSEKSLNFRKVVGVIDPVPLKDKFKWQPLVTSFPPTMNPFSEQPDHKEHCEILRVGHVGFLGVTER